ncbi:callose synthase 12-like [Gossypium australe]|uniref:Callose synthase 12-like n=1 Tax=Gossypium australe TaxID=47621 RepID=A0A5B6WX21_9ROSI|nr:callose synthase 12-like [Gossypium australe]
MIITTKQLLDSTIAEHEWDWQAIFSVSNKFIIGLLWLPVVLVYLADTQIWYSIYSLFVGAAMGLLQLLGEIRNIKQMRWRFRLSSAEGEMWAATAFQNALIWNEIGTTFREEDIISDQEVELLQLPPNSWEIRIIRWPCFLLGNELLRALDLATDLYDAPDNWLWYKICKNEYRRCAVIETYDCVKYLMLHKLIKSNTEEHSIHEVLFQEIDHSIEIKKFTKTFRMIALRQIHSKLIKLVVLLLEPNKNLNEIATAMQSLYAIVVSYLFKANMTMDQLRKDGLG